MSTPKKAALPIAIISTALIVVAGIAYCALTSWLPAYRAAQLKTTSSKLLNSYFTAKYKYYLQLYSSCDMDEAVTTASKNHDTFLTNSAFEKDPLFQTDSQRSRYFEKACVLLPNQQRTDLEDHFTQQLLHLKDNPQSAISITDIKEISANTYSVAYKVEDRNALARMVKQKDTYKLDIVDINRPPMAEPVSFTADTFAQIVEDYKLPLPVITSFQKDVKEKYGFPTVYRYDKPVKYPKNWPAFSTSAGFSYVIMPGLSIIGDNYRFSEDTSTIPFMVRQYLCGHCGSPLLRFHETDASTGSEIFRISYFTELCYPEKDNIFQQKVSAIQARVNKIWEESPLADYYPLGQEVLENTESQQNVRMSYWMLDDDGYGDASTIYVADYVITDQYKNQLRISVKGTKAYINEHATEIATMIDTLKGSPTRQKTLTGKCTEYESDQHYQERVVSERLRT